MTVEKLHQNRVVVLGYDYNDARLHAQRNRAIKNPNDVVVVSAAGHITALLGGVGGMHVATVFVTPGAHRGENYEAARRALQRCLLRTGGDFINLDGEGGTYASL